MQNRPKSPLQIVYAPVPLPSDFPILGGSTSDQRDEPITRVHIHDALEIGYCHEGSGIFVIEDQVYSYRSGDACVINDQEVHLAQSVQGTVSRWSWIYLAPAQLVQSHAEEPEFLSTAALGGARFPHLLREADYPAVAQLVRQMVEELRDRKRGFRSAVRGLVWTLMAKLHRIAGPVPARDTASRREAVVRIAPALDHVARQYPQPLSVAELARLCHTSPTNLRRLFHQAVGRSPQEYLTQLRIRMAAALLQSTSRPITVIAADVGYPTLSSFNRHFKRIMGVPPRRWRHAENAV